jgi:hypothetical protein
VSRNGGDEDADLAADWLRLRRAALFFAIRVLIVVLLAAVGLYH